MLDREENSLPTSLPRFMTARWMYQDTTRAFELMKL